MLLVVDDVEVEVELVDDELVDVEERDDDELDDDVEVVTVVLGGPLVEVVVVGAPVELVLEVDEAVTVVDRRVLLLVLEVLVEASWGRVVRVVLVVVVITCGRLVDVVLAATGGRRQMTGAGAFRAAKRRGWSRFTDAPANSMQ